MSQDRVDQDAESLDEPLAAYCESPVPKHAVQLPPKHARTGSDGFCTERSSSSGCLGRIKICGSRQLTQRSECLTPDPRLGRMPQLLETYSPVQRLCENK